MYIEQFLQELLKFKGENVKEEAEIEGVLQKFRESFWKSPRLLSHQRYGFFRDNRPDLVCGMPT